jgi:hypothetical protein
MQAIKSMIRVATHQHTHQVHLKSAFPALSSLDLVQRCCLRLLCVCWWSLCAHCCLVALVVVVDGCDAMLMDE